MKNPYGESPEDQSPGRGDCFAHLSPEEAREWQNILAAGIQAQRLVSGSVAVGGTAAALYAGHRISHDVDNLLPALKDTFDNVLDTLEQAPQWKTARIKRPLLILGNLDGVEIGFRQAKRTDAVETVSINTGVGDIIIPTLTEMIGMKAFLAYSRNVVRDYLDFAALTTCTDEAQVLEALGALDRHYGHLQSASVGLEVAKALSKPEPSDLQASNLEHYRALAPDWHDWRRIQQICQRLGVLLGRLLVGA